MDQVSITNLIAVALAMALAAAIPRAAAAPPGSRRSAGDRGMLFLMAGFEMDPAVLRGRPMRNALAGWTMTAIIALAAALLLSAAGLASAPALTALALSTTTIGALMPMLRDAARSGRLTARWC